MTTEETYRIKGDEIFLSEANVIKAIKQEYFDYLATVKTGKYDVTKNMTQDEIDSWYWQKKRGFDFYLYPKRGHIIELGFYTVSITIPDNISDLKYLKKLDLVDCNLRGFPPSFSQLDALRNINLSFNDMEVLPKEVLDLKNLECLFIGNNKFTDLKTIIENFVNLKQLGADSNLIQVIPKSIIGLKNLFSLNLENNNISQIPDELYDLPELEFLHLSNNQFEGFSESMGKLEKLETLSLKYNFISDLPDSIGDLKNLLALDLSYNKLNKFRESISRLYNLKRLYLSNNDIEILPNSIGKLKSLVTFQINNNNLKKIPRSIRTLHRLRRLEIAGNKLKLLPESISKMPDLEFILFKNNNFTQFPYFSNLIMVPSLSMGYKTLDTLQIGMDTSKELSIVDLLKNLKADPNKLKPFYSHYFKFMDEEEKSKLPRSVLDFVEKKDFMGLMAFYQPDLIGRGKPKTYKKMTKFSKKTKRKKKTTYKKITKFEKKPQSRVKEKLQVIAQTEAQMKKLREKNAKLSQSDPIKTEIEKKLKDLNLKLSSMKKNFSFK